MAIFRGWIFCLNSDHDSENGSKWGYIEDFLRNIKYGSREDAKVIRVDSIVYGRPCRRDLRLREGDGIAFYHGKKSRRASNNLSPVRPYQLTMIARIDRVQQAPTGEVEHLTFTIPRELFDSLQAQPLLKNDTRVAEIMDSTGLGGGAVGTFFPIDNKHWHRLSQLLSSSDDDMWEYDLPEARETEDTDPDGDFDFEYDEEIEDEEYLEGNISWEEAARRAEAQDGKP